MQHPPRNIVSAELKNAEVSYTGLACRFSPRPSAATRVWVGAHRRACVRGRKCGDTKGEAADRFGSIVLTVPCPLLRGVGSGGLGQNLYPVAMLSQGSARLPPQRAEKGNKKEWKK